MGKCLWNSKLMYIMVRTRHFKIFFALILVCLGFSFVLFLHSPNAHRDPTVGKRSQSLFRNLPMENNIIYINNNNGDDGYNDNRDAELPKIDINSIAGDKLPEESLVYHPQPAGLTFRNREFFLSAQSFRIFSGSVHYFRIVPEHWRDRLLKLKACGLNTVETYIPWNLHEPSQGQFNFDGILDVRAFLKMAGEIGLYVILRPGPYICSEIDFGGLPGWLLEDEDMRVRSNYGPYLKAVKLYFDVLLPILVDLQFTQGGPIIMFQVENEYAVYGEDVHHLKILIYILKSAGIREMLVTSDNSFADEKMFVPKYALPTSNANHFKKEHYKAIMEMNPHFPFMIMELWSGWFDSWGQARHSRRSTKDVITAINATMRVGGSFNLYMFHGGTNFGFMAGAINLTEYSPFVTSYDYDAVLTEAGDITPKYTAIRSLMAEFYKTIGFSQLPVVPLNARKENYGRLEVKEHIPWMSLCKLIPVTIVDTNPNFMEKYTKTNQTATTLGYILYSHQMDKSTHTSLPGIQLSGYVKDRLLAIMNGVTFYVLHGEHSAIDQFMEYQWDRHFTRIMDKINERSKMSKTLDLLVENQGRISYSPRHLDLLNQQRKGLHGPAYSPFLGSMNNWQIRHLSFSEDQIDRFSNSSAWTTWTDIAPKNGRLAAPALFRAFLILKEKPVDTFVRLEGWTKGVVIVNQFVLGRYWKLGPTQTLYLPGPLLHEGKNEIMIFEEVMKGSYISFETNPDLGPTT